MRGVFKIGHLKDEIFPITRVNLYCSENVLYASKCNTCDHMSYVVPINDRVSLCYPKCWMVMMEDEDEGNICNPTTPSYVAD